MTLNKELIWVELLKLFCGFY